MAATAPVQSAPLVAAQPIQQHLPPVNLRFVKGLAVTQLCIGLMSFVIGAFVLGFYLGSLTGAGLWAGGWVFLTGFIGLRHSKNGRNSSCAYMSLSIVSTFTSLLAGWFSYPRVYYFVFGGVCEYELARDCSNRILGIGLNVLLLVLMLIEFIVSIVAAVLCCKNNGCRCCACCVSVQPGVIQQQPYIPVAYPSGGYPSNTQYATQVVPQYGAQAAPQYGVQVVPQYGAQMMPQYGAHMVPQYSARVQQASTLHVQQTSQPYTQSSGMQPQVMALPYPGERTNGMHLEKLPPYDEHN